jgi:lipopolysaccharide assembly outer membrane protein LptD (OstA)
VGDLKGKPKFKDKGGNYDSETMRYNFKSKRGYITNVLTEQGEGFVVGGKTKKMPNDELYMTDCKYTTCDNHDHPHFYFNLTKAKVIPKKNIVTGPAYLVLEDVPLPLAIPFGSLYRRMVMSLRVVSTSETEDIILP